MNISIPNLIKKRTFRKIDRNMIKKIITFLPFEDFISKLVTINKKFFSTIQGIDIIQFLQSNLKRLLIEIDFANGSLENLKSDCSKFNLSKNDFLHLSLYILSLKYKTQEQIKIQKIPNFKTNEFLMEETFEIFCQFLERNKSIVKLNLAFLNLGDREIQFQKFCKSLKINMSIRKLNLNNNKLAEKKINFKLFCNVLKEKASLVSLKLGFNDIGISKENFKILFDALETSKSSLIKLFLHGTKMGLNNMNDILFLESFMNNNHTIEKLNISFNNYLYQHENIFETLAHIICQENSKLKALDISNIFLSIYSNKNLRDFSIFYHALSNNSNIKHLNMSSSFLCQNKENFKSFCQCLEKNFGLEHLDISKNKIGVDRTNLYYLKTALINNFSLKSINLLDNNIGHTEEDIEFITDVLVGNSFLETIKIFDNTLPWNIENFIKNVDPLNRLINS